MMNVQRAVLVCVLLSSTLLGGYQIISTGETVAAVGPATAVAAASTSMSVAACTPEEMARCLEQGGIPLEECRRLCAEGASSPEECRQACAAVSALSEECQQACCAGSMADRASSVVASQAGALADCASSVEVASCQPACAAR